MPRQVILACILLILPGVTMAGESIIVRADVSGSSCSVADAGPAPLTVFVLHNAVYGSVGANLRVIESAGFDATFVDENNPFYHQGTFRDGVNVIYAECVSSIPFLIGTITYQTHGTSGPCSTLDTTGNPNWVGGYTPYPITSTCSFEWYPAPSTGPLIVNPSSACPSPCAVKAETSSWGKVKALYRN